MKAVFVLAIVLVTAAVLINAVEDQKKKHERNHDNKDNKEHKDRNHEVKDRNKKEHHAKKDRHVEKHDVKKDRVHKKDEGKKDRSSVKHVDKDHHKVDNHADRTAIINKKPRHSEASTCAANMKPCCDPNHCIITCKDKDDEVRFIECMCQNWWSDFINRFIGTDAETERKPTEKPEVEGDGSETKPAKDACTPEHEHYKCVCEDGLFLNDDGNTCVAKRDCPKDSGDGQQDDDGAEGESE